MDPFRDELAASHAKIAELEEQIRRLTVELEKARAFPETLAQRKSNQTALMMVLFGGMFVLAGMLVAMALFFSGHSSPAP